MDNNRSKIQSVYQSIDTTNYNLTLPESSKMITNLTPPSKSKQKDEFDYLNLQINQIKTITPDK